MLSPKDFVQSPEAMAKVHSLAEAEAYTRWLATSHYENFQVVSVLLPKRLHQDFYNVYSFCRWADDLGDEIGDTAESLRLLAWWRVELHRMYERGEASHPVFVALLGTAKQYSLPIAPFNDLITAFIQDQTVTRYADWDGVFGYCKNSANPVGRLVLGLCGYHDAERQRLSDYTCTALQLANFWQDVAVDLKKDRVYIPLDIMARHGYTVEELFAHRFNPAFAAVMRASDGRQGKLPATKFLTTSFLVGNYPGRPQDQRTIDDTTKQAWADFYADFANHPPRYLVDTSTSDVRGADNYPIWKFPRLAKIVAEHYHYDTTIDGYDIYVRK